MTKYTDEQIKTAFEHCYEDDACENCPLQNDMKTCDSLYGLISDLINRQEAEIERLKKYNTDVAYKHYNDGIKAFAERLKEIYLKDKRYALPNAHTLIVKLFSNINNLVKEMVGEGE